MVLRRPWPWAVFPCTTAFTFTHSLFQGTFMEHLQINPACGSGPRLYKGIRKLPLVVHRLLALVICYNMEKEELTRQKREGTGGLTRMNNLFKWLYGI